MDKLKETKVFLQSLTDDDEIKMLIEDRVGKDLNDYFHQQAVSYSKSTLATEDKETIHGLTTFMLLGFLMRTHLERKEMGEVLLGR